MTNYYADSSVLVKRHVPETGTTWFRHLTTPTANHVIITARISMVELYSALNRRVRERTLGAADYITMVADFTALCLTNYQLVELSPIVVDRAKHLLEHHPLRAYDAIQLASAIIVNDALQIATEPPLIFLTADNRLLTVAQAEGMLTDNPNLHP